MFYVRLAKSHVSPNNMYHLYVLKRPLYIPVYNVNLCGRTHNKKHGTDAIFMFYIQANQSLIGPP